MQSSVPTSAAVSIAEPEGRGNAGAVESVENQTQVFHASHRPLKIPQNRRDFHISTASDDIHSLNPKTERKEVGRYAASPFSFPTLPLVERTDFMLIFQLENAPPP